MSKGLKLPDHKKYGKVENGINGDKYFRPTMKGIIGTIAIATFLFGALTTATAWVLGQTKTQSDTTKKVVELRSRIEVLENDSLANAVNQQASWEIQKLLLKKLYPDTAEQLITQIETTRNTLKKELKRQANSRKEKEANE